MEKREEKIGVRHRYKHSYFRLIPKNSNLGGDGAGSG